MRHHLPVRKSVVNRAAHRPHIALPLLGTNRRACELPIGQLDRVPCHGLVHHRQIVIADLIAESARARVDNHRHRLRLEPHDACGLLVIDLRDVPKFQEVITGAERADLRSAALHRALGYVVRVGAADAAAFLDVVEIGRAAVTLRDGPFGTAGGHPPQLICRDCERARRPHARRHASEEMIHKLLHVLGHVLPLQLRRHQPYAAVDVVTDASRRYHPLVHIKCRHASDRKSVAPVHVRHGERRPHNPRHVRHVHSLLRRVIGLDVAEHLPGRIDARRNAHAPGSRNLPDVIGDFLDGIVRHIDAHSPQL